MCAYIFKKILWFYVTIIRFQINAHNGNSTSLSLTHWGRVMHICIGKLTNIGSDNCLSSGWHQAIIWTNDGQITNAHMRHSVSMG